MIRLICMALLCVVCTVSFPQKAEAQRPLQRLRARVQEFRQNRPRLIQPRGQRNFAPLRNIRSRMQNRQEFLRDSREFNQEFRQQGQELRKENPILPMRKNDEEPEDVFSDILGINNPNSDDGFDESKWIVISTKQGVS